MKKRLLFIINPIAGTKSKKDIEGLIKTHTDTSNCTYDIAYTKHAGHAVTLAQQAASDNFDIVIAVGGDGTINEVARALIHTNTALGIIPLGSGNGLARHLSLPLTIPEAIQIINEGIIHRLDYGMMNDIPFFCTCGVGFDAYISHLFAQDGKRGAFSYLDKVIRTGLDYKSETYEVACDAFTETLDAFLITCANASQYGNNAYIAPEASMKDGLLDVTIIKPFTMLEAPQIGIQLFNKKLLSNDHIITFKTRELYIRRLHEGPAHYDGDPLIAAANINVAITSKQINIVVNSRSDRKEQNILSSWSDQLFSYLSNPIHRMMEKSSNHLDQHILSKLRNFKN